MSLTRYVLPKRNLGAARKMGWIPIGIGLFITLFMIFWMGGPIASGVASHGVGRWLGIGFGLLGLPGLLAGLGLIALGVVILGNLSHSEIVIGEGRLCAIERVGRLPIRRSRRIADLSRLIVQKGGITVSSGNTGASQTYAPHLAALEAETTTGKPMKVAIGYPADMLRPLADVLAGSLSLTGQSALREAPEAVLEVIETEAGGPETDREISKPSETDITCTQDARGVAIAVPPAGVRKGSQGLFVFSLFWNGFMVVFTALMMKARPPVGVLLFLALFWGIGVAMVLISINLGKRQVLLVVANHLLAYRVTGLFKPKEQKIPLDSIITVQVGPSGMEINHQPVMEVQILLKTGRKIGLFSNRSPSEKEWLAFRLRQSLKG